MSARAQPQYVAVNCTTLGLNPTVDAGMELGFRVKASCQPPCDLEGELVTVTDAQGQVMLRAPLGAYDEDADANLTDVLRIRAPNRPSEYVWSILLAGYGDDAVIFEDVCAPLAFEVRPHCTSIVVWDVPAGVPVGERFTVKLGVKCSSGCSQAHRDVTITNDANVVLAVAKAGSNIWPKSKAINFTEVELSAPPTEGVIHLLAQCQATDLADPEGEGGIAHDAASCAFEVRTVRALEHKVRIEAWDAAADAPIPGARVTLHPFSAVADANGMAELSVPGGDYRLFVSRTKFTTFGLPVAIGADFERRVALYHEPPPNRE